MKEELSKSYLSIGQSFLIAGIVILGTLVFAPMGMFLDESMGKEEAALIYYLCSMGVPLWVIYLIRKRKVRSTFFNVNIQHPSVLPFITVATVALVFGIILPVSDLIPVPEDIKEMLADSASEKGIPTFITLVIAAPVIEELIFRGIMLDGLLRKHAPAKSIFITSLLFGLVHLNPWQFIAGFILGIFIGWLYYETRNLSYAIVIHTAANLCGYLLRVFSDKDSLINDSIVEIYGGMVNLVFIALGSVGIVMGCIYFLKREFSKEKLKLTAHSTKLYTMVSALDDELK